MIASSGFADKKLTTDTCVNYVEKSIVNHALIYESSRVGIGGKF